MRDLYVDDSTNSFDEVHECQRFFEISKTCLAAANFNLRKWATNNSDLHNVMNNALHTDKEQGSSEHENIRELLGLDWDLDNDTFIFEFNEILQILQTVISLPITKRNILKIGGMFFDPLGLLSPLTLKAKLLFQEVCSLKLDWDCKVEDEALVHRWDSFLWELENLNHLDISRHVLCCSHRVVQLHGFCNTSGKAYYTCVYIRVSCWHGVRVRLLTSKNHLVPSKPLSIPRSELLSCVYFLD